MAWIDEHRQTNLVCVQRVNWSMISSPVSTNPRSVCHNYHREICENVHRLLNLLACISLQTEKHTSLKNGLLEEIAKSNLLLLYNCTMSVDRAVRTVHGWCRAFAEQKLAARRDHHSQMQESVDECRVAWPIHNEATTVAMEDESEVDLLPKTLCKTIIENLRSIFPS